MYGEKLIITDDCETLEQEKLIVTSPNGSKFRIDANERGELCVSLIYSEDEKKDLCVISGTLRADICLKAIDRV